MGGTIFFSLCVLVKTQNRSWNRDFFAISPDFIHFWFFKRFSTQSMFWLVKSYDFKSENAILTTLKLSKLIHTILGEENDEHSSEKKIYRLKPINIKINFFLDRNWCQPRFFLLFIGYSPLELDIKK
jgi:hypothetical protein